MSEYLPEDLADRMPERMLEYLPDRTVGPGSECYPPDLKQRREKEKEERISLLNLATETQNSSKSIRAIISSFLASKILHVRNKVKICLGILYRIDAMWGSLQAKSFSLESLIFYLNFVVQE